LGTIYWQILRPFTKYTIYWWILIKYLMVPKVFFDLKEKKLKNLGFFVENFLDQEMADPNRTPKK